MLLFWLFWAMFGYLDGAPEVIIGLQIKIDILLLQDFCLFHSSDQVDCLRKEAESFLVDNCNKALQNLHLAFLLINSI